jgi:geranylgeranyl diphosphate synthase type II
LDLDRYLNEKVELINGALDRLLPGEEQYPQSLHRAMRYSIFAGGKRIRPVLVLASAEAVAGPGGVNTEAAISAACAFECIHTYSLIHDDLPAIDNDDLRRGRATCHKVFGEAAAILAGDALLTIAFELIASPGADDFASCRRVVHEVSRAAGSKGMIGGQVVDIESEGKDIDSAILEHIHIHKTGALILSAVRCGAFLAGAGNRELECLTRYGEAVGLAFQIADDILDVEGESREMGKATGGDEKKKKATYPALFGLTESKEIARELVEKALKALEDFDNKADPLRAVALYIVERRR